MVGALSSFMNCYTRFLVAKAISKESITPCYKGPRNGFPLQKVEGSDSHLCTFRAG